jgi:hypothetical protein
MLESKAEVLNHNQEFLDAFSYLLVGNFCYATLPFIGSYLRRFRKECFIGPNIPALIPPISHIVYANKTTTTDYGTSKQKYSRLRIILSLIPMYIFSSLMGITKYL